MASTQGLNTGTYSQNMTMPTSAIFNITNPLTSPIQVLNHLPVVAGASASLSNLLSASVPNNDSVSCQITPVLDNTKKTQVTILATVTVTTEVTMETNDPASAIATSTVGVASAVAAMCSETAIPTLEGASGEGNGADLGRNRDPKDGPFLGGVPTITVDVPVAIVFLIIFGLGALTHISIYRANSKRGHKFLLSDLLFDFCMVRVVTCIFRIIWAATGPRGVVLAANIFENGGAAVIFAVNLFFAQRIVRAMHPSIGWHPAFSHLSLFLIFSVPAVIVMNIVTLSVNFFSVGKPAQLQATVDVLRLGASWNMMLAVMPLLWLFLASAKPGPPPENFGIGDFRAKAALLVFSSGTLAFGAAVRLSASVDSESLEATSPLFSKGVFYTTGFLLESITVVAYAFFRVDLLFHVPNGASGPGDYSDRRLSKPAQPRLATSAEIEIEISKLGVRYDILSSRNGEKQSPLFLIVYPAQLEQPPATSEKDPPSLADEDTALPPRQTLRVSRRQSLMEVLRPDRPARAERKSEFMA